MAAERRPSAPSVGPLSPAIAGLAVEWRARGAVCREIGDERGALMYSKLAGELEEALADSGGALLTLAEASRRSGYSDDHLRRLMREGVLHNYGRKGAPRVQEAQLPRKPGAPALTRSPDGAMSRSQIARVVVPSQEAKR